MTLVIPLAAALIGALVLAAFLRLAWLRARRVWHTNPGVTALDPGQVPARLRGLLDEVGPALGALGFEPAGVAQVDRGPRDRRLVALFSHAGSQDTAWLETGGPGRRPSSTFRFLTVWGIERAVVTTNARAGHPFGEIRGHQVAALPGEKDLARLHVLHRSRVQAAATGDGETPRGGRRLDLLRTLLRRWGEVQVMRGNLVRRGLPPCYRLTWRGAFRLLRAGLPGGRAARRRAVPGADPLPGGVAVAYGVRRESPA